MSDIKSKKCSPCIVTKVVLFLLLGFLIGSAWQKHHFRSPGVGEEVMNFEVGQTLMLNVDQDADIDIRCSGVPMLKGKTGMIGRHKAVRVERVVGMNERVT